MVRRLERVEREVRYNRELREARRGVPSWFLVVSILLACGMLVTGFVLGQDSRSFDETNSSYNIGDYSFHLTTPSENSEMNGLNGYTWVGSSTVYLNKELIYNKNFEQLKRTCEHELLHTLGIGSKHHDLIDLYEFQVDTPVCRELLYQVKK